MRKKKQKKSDWAIGGDGVKVIDNNVELHFANELCSLRNNEDMEHIKKIFGFVHDNIPPDEVLGFSK